MGQSPWENDRRVYHTNSAWLRVLRPIEGEKKDFSTEQSEQESDCTISIKTWLPLNLPGMSVWRVPFLNLVSARALLHLN